MSSKPWKFANVDQASNAVLLARDDEDDFLFHQNDIVYQIGLLEKPGAVVDFWKEKAKPNRSDWTHPLSEWESDYIRSFRASTVPEPLRMHEPVSAGSLSSEQKQEAVSLFPGAQCEERYANFENRRLIMAHYVYTHPATVRMELGLYRLLRDINPLHFSLERGWQMGCGKEMFTEEPVSRLGAAAEFFSALALSWAVGHALRASRGASPQPRQGLIGDDARFAQTDYRNAFSKQQGARFSGWTVDDVTQFLRSKMLHPRHVPVDFIVRDGNVLILNTRSAQALTQAGIPRSQWFCVNRTGNPVFEARLNGQLFRNGLTSEGTKTVTRVGK